MWTVAHRQTVLKNKRNYTKINETASTLSVVIFWIHEVSRTGKLDAEVGGGGSRRGISPPTHLGNINVSFYFSIHI